MSAFSTSVNDHWSAVGSSSAETDMVKGTSTAGQSISGRATTVNEALAWVPEGTLPRLPEPLMLQSGAESTMVARLASPLPWFSMVTSKTVGSVASAMPS